MDLNSKPIVVACEGGFRHDRAVDAAARLAGLTGSTLHVVTATPRPLAELVPDLPRQAKDRLVAEVEATVCGIHRREAERWAERGIDAQIHRETGDPAAALQRVALAVDAGLIVMSAAQGRRQTRRVARSARCDVLLVAGAA